VDPLAAVASPEAVHPPHRQATEVSAAAVERPVLAVAPHTADEHGILGNLTKGPDGNVASGLFSFG